MPLHDHTNMFVFNKILVGKSKSTVYTVDNEDQDK